MLIVKSYLSKSPIHGVGVFAEEQINKGMMVNYYNPLFDQAFSPEELLKFPKAVRDFVRSHGYLDSERMKYILSSDNSKYMNHSNNPNMTPDGDCDIACKDIFKNEEITCNYFTFDAEAAIKLGLRT
jgi:hypothetical protein